MASTNLQLPIRLEVQITGAKWSLEREGKYYWVFKCKECEEDHYYGPCESDDDGLPVTPSLWTADESTAEELMSLCRRSQEEQVYEDQAKGLPPQVPIKCPKTKKRRNYFADNFQKHRPPQRLICEILVQSPREADVHELRKKFLLIPRDDVKKLLAFLNKYGDFDLMPEFLPSQFWEWQDIVAARLKTKPSEWKQVKKQFDPGKISRFERGFELTPEWKDGLPDYKIVIDRCIHALAASIQIDLADRVKFRICPWCKMPFSGAKNKQYCCSYHSSLGTREMREHPDSPLSKKLLRLKKQFEKSRKN